eukprot:NODE_589_length_5652_cov_0.848730.p5 type:complete len:122 gc:universal NODE_589_length_5652_cov_0.848730:5141-4776(-)
MKFWMVSIWRKSAFPPLFFYAIPIPISNYQRMHEESLFDVHHSDYSSSCYDFSRICLFGQADLIKSKCFGYSVNRFKRDKSKVSSAISSRKLTLDAPDTSSDSSESSSIINVGSSFSSEFG